jgi:sigma-B regulation protein RsbU (phosphoserine phosphatase)
LDEKNITVLLVEDEPAMQALFGFSLKKEGYTVLKAMNGIEGIKQLETELPDAIISDIMMPDMDGFTFREEILKNDTWSDIPFLFLTAFDNEENIIRGLSLGAEDFIPKTDGAKVVASKLKNALRKRIEIKKRFVGEMDAASRSTGVLLKPPKPPVVDGFNVEHFQKSHEDVPGGDFLDYLKIGDQLLIVMGDVMGKHWKAWVFAHAYAGYVRSTIRSIASDFNEEIRPSEILRRLNKAIYRDDQVGESICALTLISVNLKTKRVSVSNALQYPLLFFDKKLNELKDIQMDAPLLGLRPDSNFEEISFQMLPGDRLIAATDGITEIRNPYGDLLGFDFFKKNLLEMMQLDQISAEKIVNGIYAAAGVNKPQDDATILVINAL